MVEGAAVATVARSGDERAGAVRLPRHPHDVGRTGVSRSADAASDTFRAFVRSRPGSAAAAAEPSAGHAPAADGVSASATCRGSSAVASARSRARADVTGSAVCSFDAASGSGSPAVGAAGECCSGPGRRRGPGSGDRPFARRTGGCEQFPGPEARADGCPAHATANASDFPRGADHQRRRPTRRAGRSNAPPLGHRSTVAAPDDRSRGQTRNAEGGARPRAGDRACPPCHHTLASGAEREAPSRPPSSNPFYERRRSYAVPAGRVVAAVGIALVLLLVVIRRRRRPTRTPRRPGLTCRL